MQSNMSGLKFLTQELKRTPTVLDPEKVKALAKLRDQAQFKDFCELSLGHFIQAMHDIGIHDNDFIAHLFGVWDSDNNGTLNYREFMFGLALLNDRELDDNKLKALFQLFDVDNNGTIERHEFENLVHLGCVASLVPVTEEEIPRFVNSIFKTVDVNQDNKISFEEFRKAVYEHQLFLNTVHFVDLVERLKDFQDLQEKAKHGRNLLRVSHSMQDYVYNGVQPDHELHGMPEKQKSPKPFRTMAEEHHIYRDDRIVGLKELTRNEKYTHLAVIQLLKPDFDFDTLLKFHESFEKISHKKGFVDKQDFIQTLNDAGIEDERFAEHLFQLWDKDGNGTLDYNEFMLSMCNSSKVGTDEEKLKFVFNIYDLDGDGFITRSELYKFFAVLHPDLDSSDHQFIHTVDRLFSLVDKNHDNKISFEEFKEGVLQNNLLMKLPEISSILDNAKNNEHLAKKMNKKSFLRVSGMRSNDGVEYID